MKLVKTNMHNVVNLHSLDVGDAFSVPNFTEDLYIKVTEFSGSNLNVVNLRTGELAGMAHTLMVILRKDIIITTEK